MKTTWACDSRRTHHSETSWLAIRLAGLQGWLVRAKTRQNLETKKTLDRCLGSDTAG